MAAATVPMVWADGHQGSTEHCAACGRKLRGTPQWVEVIDGGSSVAAPGLDPDTADAGYMGWFRVGPECARRHFRGFTSGGVPDQDQWRRGDGEHMGERGALHQRAIPDAGPTESDLRGEVEHE